MAAKVRPCVVPSVSAHETERQLVTVVPHTTAFRSSRFEVRVSAGYLREGAFDAQGIVTVPKARLMNRLGMLRADDLKVIEAAVRARLGLAS